MKPLNIKETRSLIERMNDGDEPCFICRLVSAMTPVHISMASPAHMLLQYTKSVRPEGVNDGAWQPIPCCAAHHLELKEMFK
jgi:hypothetical protein